MLSGLRILTVRRLILIVGYVAWLENSCNFCYNNHSWISGLFIRAEAFGEQPASNWQGFFSVSSYTQYFNVDTDVVVNRLISSLNPVADDFFGKIDANPDLWVLILPFATILSITKMAIVILITCGKCGAWWKTLVDYCAVVITFTRRKWNLHFASFTSTRFSSCFLFGLFTVVDLHKVVYFPNWNLRNWKSYGWWIMHEYVAALCKLWVLEDCRYAYLWETWWIFY